MDLSPGTRTLPRAIGPGVIADAHGSRPSRQADGIEGPRRQDAGAASAADPRRPSGARCRARPRASARSAGPRCSPGPPPSAEVSSSEGARAVRDRDLEHRDARADLRLGGEPQASPLRADRTSPRTASASTLEDHRPKVLQPARSNRSIASAMASRFARRIWLHSAGLDEASRVRSRNPPAASRRISGSSASSVAASAMRAVDATWGRWLTNATSRSWRAGRHPDRASADPFDPGLEPVDRARWATPSSGVEHPHDAVDHRGRGVLGPRAFRSPHGVTTDEPLRGRRAPGLFDLAHQMLLDASNVGDDRRRRCLQRPGRQLRRDRDRGAHRPRRRRQQPHPRTWGRSGCRSARLRRPRPRRPDPSRSPGTPPGPTPSRSTCR